MKSIQLSRIIAVGLVSLLQISNVLAQKSTNRFEELAGILMPDDRITVVLTSGERLKGRTVEVTAASVVISTGKSQQPRTIPSLDIARISVPDPVRNGIKIGAGIGAGAGLVGGLLLNTLCSNETGACPGAVVALTAAGLVGGAAAGWGLDSAHGSRTVYDRSTVPIEREQATVFFASVNYSRISNLVFPASTFRAPSQVSLSAGVGRHWSSGFGIEGEVQRTIQSAVRQNPCIKASFGSLIGNCIGTGLEGLESQLAGTGRVVYSLSSVRFQPFVSVGFSLLQRVEPFAYADTAGVLKVVQARARFNETAVPVGGGFRVELTPSIAIRPAVTYYIGAHQTSASVGIVYRRN